MDRTYAGSMVIVSLYMASALVMLTWPQLPLFLFIR